MSRSKDQRGRPSKLPGIEDRIGVPIELYVLAEVAAGRLIPQVAAALGVQARTLRVWLRSRGYRIESHCQLVKTDRPRAGRGTAAPRSGVRPLGIEAHARALHGGDPRGNSAPARRD